MLLLSWLRSLPSRSSSPARQRWVRPLLEALEERLTPSSNPLSPAAGPAAPALIAAPAAASGVFSPDVLPNGGTGSAYDQVITANVTGNNSMTFTLAPGNSIPTGLTFTPGANELTIAGTPTAAGTVAFTVTATDDSGTTFNQDYQLTVFNTLEFSLNSLPDGTVGGAYSQVIAPVAGVGVSAVTSQVLSGIVPTGLLILPTAFSGGNQITFSGTPTTAGTIVVALTASDSADNSFTQDYTLTINPAPVLSPASLPNGAVGVAYDQLISASGGTGDKTLTYSIASGSIPPGVTITSVPNGLLLSGTPTTSGLVGLQVMATDAAGGSVTQKYVLTITGSVVLPPNSLPSGTVGAAYNQTIHVGSGTSDATFAVTSGLIPAGLTFTSGVNQLVIGGTPTTPGAVGFEVTSSDGTVQNFVLTVNPPVALVPGGLPGGSVGTTYDQTISATGGSGDKTVSFSVVSGSIPAGLSIATGTDQLVISGTPSAGGTATLVVTATDAAGAVVSQNYVLTVGGGGGGSPPSTTSATQIQKGSEDIFSMALSLLTGNATLFVQSLADYHSLPAAAQQAALQILGSDLVRLSVLGQGNSDTVNTLLALDLALTFHLI